MIWHVSASTNFDRVDTDGVDVPHEKYNLCEIHVVVYNYMVMILIRYREYPLNI